MGHGDSISTPAEPLWTAAEPEQRNCLPAVEQAWQAALRAEACWKELQRPERAAQMDLRERFQVRAERRVYPPRNQEQNQAR